VNEALAAAEKVGYPVLVRPSYVLGGRAMVIAYDAKGVKEYMGQAVEYSQDRPILIDHFLEEAIEIDVDALCDGEDVVIGGIMQHIEEAGIHSGDSSCVLPAVDIPAPVLNTIRDHTYRLARALKVVGLMNVQYAIQREKVFVIEVNPRASRTVPYVSKATGVPLAKIAARLMTGRRLREFLPEYVELVNRGESADLSTGECFYVKSPVFPWGKFPGVDTVLGPEMRSTGEVMGVADNFGEAFARAQLAAGQLLPSRGTVCLSVSDRDKPVIAEVARRFVDLGFKIAATHGTAEVLEQAGMHVERVYKVMEGRPNVVDLVKGGRIKLIINTPHGFEPWFDEKAIRRAAITARVPTMTTLSAARAAAEGIAALQRGEVSVRDLQTLHGDARKPQPVASAQRRRQ
jgi:carbamoyl-phosphate synthase large subunit